MNPVSAIQALASILWSAFVFVLIIMAVRASRKQSVGKLTALTIGLIIAALLLTVIGAGLVFIEPYEVGVVVSVLAPGGMRSEPLNAGLHWIVPFVERVERYEISKQTYSMTSSPGEYETAGQPVEARTADGQRIFVDSSVIYQIDPAHVVDIHRTWQHRYESALIHPQTRGIIRDAVSQYRVEEVLSTKRFEMTNQITENLRTVLQENGLILVDFVLRDITFTEEYAQSIEQKQIAEQQALQAKFVVEQRKQEAEQARQVAQGKADAEVIEAQGRAQARLIEAEAEAKALQMIAEVLRGNPELLQYQYITQLSPNVQVMFLPSESPFILPLPTPTPTPGATTP